MTIITIQCWLTASEATRRDLWELMANRNTPLVTELLEAIQTHADFEKWQRSGEIPITEARKVCRILKNDERFAGQSGRFYESASSMVADTYKAWFALQASRKRQLDGLQRWLNIVKSDAEMLEMCEVTWEVFRGKAVDVLKTLSKDIEAEQNSSASSHKHANKKKKKAVDFNSKKRLHNRLFDLYDKSPDLLTRCVSLHLLKNGCTVPEQPEIRDKYLSKLLAKQKHARRLEKQLAASMPKGRDLDSQRFQQTLRKITTQIPEHSSELSEWEAELLREPSPSPYPIQYGYGDLVWTVEEISIGKSKKPKQQICVKFNGLGKHLFKVQCDRRQHQYFQRFVTDCKSYKNGEGTLSGSLLLLRAARLVWQPGKTNSRQKVGQPWNDNYLYLHCSIETDHLTQEGVAKKRQQKIKQLTSADTSPSASQKATGSDKGNLERIQNNDQHLTDLPSRPPYSGRPQLVLGVSFGLQNPVATALVDVQSKTVLSYLSSRQLLKTSSKASDQSHLVRRHKIQQQRNRYRRHIAQLRDRYPHYHEANLGIYLNRVLAKRIVDIAQKHQVSSIALPDTKGLRDKLESQLRARAELKIVGSVSAQKRYARDASQRLHCWSYSELVQAIRGCASKRGIPVEIVTAMPAASLQETARNVALLAYHSRQSRV